MWDGSVHTLQSPTDKDGTSIRGLEEVNTRAADDQTVVSAFAQMGSLDPGDATELLDENTRSAATLEPRARPRQSSPRAVPDRLSSMLFRTAIIRVRELKSVDRVKRPGPQWRGLS